MQQRYLNAILPLFLVIFIDGLSMGIIFPILTPVYMDTNGILSASTSLHTRELLYGITLAAFPLGMFLGTPWLGDLSDQIGRKKILLVCLIMITISYILSAWAIIISSVGLLVISRLIAGLFAGSEAIAQAAVIDICPKDKKAVYLSLIIFPATLGFIVGPLLSGFLSDAKLMSWFSLWLPLVIAAIAASLNALFLWLGFRETYTLAGKKLNIKLSKAISIFIDAFTDHRIRIISIIFLSLQLSFSSYFQFIPLYLKHIFQYGNNQIGFFIALLGLCFAIGLTYGIRLVTNYLTLPKALLIMLLSLFIGSSITALTNHLLFIWLSAPLIGIGVSIAYSISITLYSNLVGAEHQGWIMGIANAIMAIAWGLTALFIGFLPYIGGAKIMLYMATFFALISIITLVIFHQSNPE